MALPFALMIAIVGPIVGLFGAFYGDPLAINIGKIGLASFMCFFIDHILVTMKLWVLTHRAEML
jgi:hypothetical protein